MSRASVRELERRLAAARARETYYANKQPTTRTAVTPRPMEKFVYASTTVRTSGVSMLYKVPASKKSVDFLGGSQILGLRTIESMADPVSERPRGFKPAQIYVMKARETPDPDKTPWNTPTIRYSDTTTGTSQAHYSAPISSGDNNATYDELDARSKDVFNQVKSKLGNLDYAKFYLTQEVFNNSRT